MLNGFEERLDQPSAAVTARQVSTTGSKGGGDVETLPAFLALHVTPAEPERLSGKVVKRDLLTTLLKLGKLTTIGKLAVTADTHEQPLETGLE